MGVGAGEDDVCGRQAAGLTDALLEAGDQLFFHGQQVKADERGLGQPVVEKDGAGVEVVMDAGSRAQGIAGEQAGMVRGGDNGITEPGFHG